MKRTINKVLAMMGVGVYRIGSNAPSPSQSPRPSMREALRWLADQGIHIGSVLDVGASNGCWAAECMEFYPRADYVLFEPQPVHGAQLDEFAATRSQKVFLVKKAVGASEGVTFFDAADPFGGALADREGDHNIQVGLTTIDAALQEIKPEAPYLLKLDTHGFERSILAGAASTLHQCSALIIEAYNYRITDEAFLFWELCACLAEIGFRPVDLVDVLHRDYDRSLWQMDLVFVKDSWKGFDYLTYR